MPVIRTTEALAAACARLAGHAFVTVDTEFMRETTFWPKLCLIQMASPDEAFAVDALAEGLDLKPFLDLMADTAVTKVFHAARQDVEIIWRLGRIIPVPLFDSQVAAMVCGYGDQVSYEQLAGALAGAKIDKSSRFTDWARRPLSEAQVAYAIGDVTHLRLVYEKLSERLVKNSRRAWLDEELALLTSPDTYEQHPERAWERLKTRVRRPRDLAVLIEVAAWRDREAQARDVPRSRILKDDTVGEIAQTAPKSADELAKLRTIPKGFERSRFGEDIIAAVKRGLERDQAELPPFEQRCNAGNGAAATTQLLKVLLQSVCDQQGVAAKLVASADDLEAIACDDAADVAALRGWRRDLFGEEALALKRGDVALSVQGGKIVRLRGMAQAE